MLLKYSVMTFTEKYSSSFFFILWKKALNVNSTPRSRWISEYVTYRISIMEVGDVASGTHVLLVSSTTTTADKGFWGKWLLFIVDLMLKHRLSYVLYYPKGSGSTKLVPNKLLLKQLFFISTQFIYLKNVYFIFTIPCGNKDIL